MSLARLKSRNAGPRGVRQRGAAGLDPRARPAAGCPPHPVEAAGDPLVVSGLDGRALDRPLRPAEAEALMAALNERPPLTIRANTLRITREDLAARLRGRGAGRHAIRRARAGGAHGAPGRRRPVGRLRGGLVRDAGRGVHAGRRACWIRSRASWSRTPAPRPGPRPPTWPSSWAIAAASSPWIRTAGRLGLLTQAVVPARRHHRRGARGRRGLGVGALEGPLRPGAGGRAVLEPGRAAPQSRREVAARGDGARPARREAAGHSRRGGRAGQAGRAPGLRHLLARARGERRRRAGLPRRRIPTGAWIRPRPSRCRPTRAA